MTPPIPRTVLAALLALSIVPPAWADTPLGAAELQSLADELREHHGVTSLLIGVQAGDGPPAIAAAGTSLPGEPATPDMHGRIGALAITTLTTLLFQLDAEGAVSREATLDAWFPDYPHADTVTLEMLAASRSGYHDYVPDEGFIEAFYADVFRTWTTAELMEITFGRGMACPPGTCFTYSHANFIILGAALEAATGTPLEELVTTRVTEPLGLGDHLRFDFGAGLDAPVLHAYTDERGPFENSTFWSPSWTSATGFFSANIKGLLGLMRGLASGALLDEAAFAALTRPVNIGEAFNRDGFHYSHGILVADPWYLQAFSFGGYDGIAAYYPDRDLTIAVINTLGPGLERGPAMPIYQELRQAVGE